MTAITPPKSLDNCFPSIQDLPEDLQVLIEAYRENMKEMVKWFLKENLCDECKRKIFGKRDVKI